MTSVFKRYVQVGAVVYINYGEDKGKLAVIVEVIDHNRALIDGPTTGVKRQALSYRRMILTPIVVEKLPRSIGTGPLKKKLEKDDIVAKWEATAWAKKIATKTRRAELTDFDRFKVLKLKKQRRRILAKENAAARKVPAQ